MNKPTHKGKEILVTVIELAVIGIVLLILWQLFGWIVKLLFLLIGLILAGFLAHKLYRTLYPPKNP